jgi:hypothetical protein
MPLVSKTFSQIITFTRASTATYFDATGTLQSAAIDVPRFDYNPATLAAQGFLIEESRTNSIRNNTMQGAVAGTPGTAPTNWQATVSLNGITREIIGVGTESGITYIDVKYSGTPTANTTFQIIFEANNQIAATSGQTWTQSQFMRLAAGALTNVTSFLMVLSGRDSGGASTGEQFSDTITPTSAGLSSQRETLTGTFFNAATAFVRPSLQFNVTNGAAIDITLRIGLPQLEQGAFATSVIPTTTTALTRAADVASVNTLSPWYNASAGTLYAEYSRLANVSGRIVTFHDTTSGEQIRINGSVSVNIRPDWQIIDGGVTQANVIGTVEIAPNAIGKTAGAYSVNDFQQATNTSLGVADTSGTVPTVSKVNLGTNEVGASNINGYLRRIVYYPRRLSDAELQSITS